MCCVTDGNAEWCSSDNLVKQLQAGATNSMSVVQLISHIVGSQHHKSQTLIPVAVSGENRFTLHHVTLTWALRPFQSQFLSYCSFLLIRPKEITRFILFLGCVQTGVEANRI